MCIYLFFKICKHRHAPENNAKYVERYSETKEEEEENKLWSIVISDDSNTPKLWVRTPTRQGVLDTTLCDKVCQWLATSQWFSLGTLVSSTNKTDGYDITEILLKVALNTIKQSNAPLFSEKKLCVCLT